MTPKRVLIMGAAGRDFHNFNVFYRDNACYHVVGFTATQIPDIEGRVYPPSLAGSRYPQGLPIFTEEDLTDIIVKEDVDEVVFAYSDVSHIDIMHKASTALAAGADFRLLGPKHSMLSSTRPVIAICAARTGAGKSQVTRYVAEFLTEQDTNVVVIRHPMPYGDLAAQKVQRYETLDDMDVHRCTIEEREEYEPHILRGNILYSGVDYDCILKEAEKEADVILWDGGNNDLPFYKPDLMITIVDPHRAGHELLYHPGETNVRFADVIIVNKIDTAAQKDIETVIQNVKSVNPSARIIQCSSPITLAHPELIKDKRVLVVEDGPTLTHGGMDHGAGLIATQNAGGIVVDPKDAAVGSLVDTYAKYPHIGPVLPAMGYSEKQCMELAETIERCDVDVVVIGTPIDLGKVIEIGKPSVRVTYDLADDTDQFAKVLEAFLDSKTK